MSESRPWHALLALVISTGAVACNESPERPPYAVTVDVVECRSEYERECLYYYENNWKVIREEAVARNFISGYHLLRAESDSLSVVKLFLLTEYPDSLALAEVEANFQPMMRELRPGGPLLLNDVVRSGFVANSMGYTTHSLGSR